MQHLHHFICAECAAYFSNGPEDKKHFCVHRDGARQQDDQRFAGLTRFSDRERPASCALTGLGWDRMAADNHHRGCGTPDVFDRA